MRVHTRSIQTITGSEGPSHDPYSFEEYVFEENGDITRIRFGALGYVRVTYSDGDEIEGYECRDNEMDVAEAFEMETGITIEQFRKSMERVHPYFDDPMGNPADFI